VISVPEQIGKICPVLDDLTMKAPVLGKVLFESTNPYVIAEVLGASKRLPQIRLSVRQAKQITRFMLEVSFLV
jgi:hypothetical protein